MRRNRDLGLADLIDRADSWGVGIELRGRKQLVTHRQRLIRRWPQMRRQAAVKRHHDALNPLTTERHPDQRALFDHAVQRRRHVVGVDGVRIAEERHADGDIGEEFRSAIGHRESISCV